MHGITMLAQINYLSLIISQYLGASLVKLPICSKFKVD